MLYFQYGCNSANYETLVTLVVLAASSAQDLPYFNVLNMSKPCPQDGFGSEVKRRILMGTYTLSAGYYDAYYKRAQQVRTLIRKEMNCALGTVDALVSPAAPTPAYPIGSKVNDPLSMYAGDLMTINVNLAGGSPD